MVVIVQVQLCAISNNSQASNGYQPTAASHVQEENKWLKNWQLPGQCLKEGRDNDVVCLCVCVRVCVWSQRHACTATQQRQTKKMCVMIMKSSIFECVSVCICVYKGWGSSVCGKAGGGGSWDRGWNVCVGLLIINHHWLRCVCVCASGWHCNSLYDAEIRGNIEMSWL